ncbi:MAG: ABC transporter ATP-binding protein [Actinomycetes bacterium]
MRDALAPGELEVREVSKAFRRPGRRSERVQALRDVSLHVGPGEAVGLVGASGSGKTTLARLVVGAARPSSGEIRFGAVAVDRLGRRSLRQYRRDVQYVFQDPYAALNPVHTVGYSLARPLSNLRGLAGRDIHREAGELLERVGLAPAAQYLAKLPHQLSGGQRQRVVIARALATRPKLLIADEPVSMLDVSLRAEILALLRQLQTAEGLSMLYITHDLLSARVATQRLVVLQQGSVVETGATGSVLQHPEHAYTRELIDAIPNPFSRPAPPPPRREQP